MENFSQATDAAKAAIDSQGSAVAENDKRLESFESKINNIKGAWQELILNIADSDKIKDLLDTVNNLLRSVANNQTAIDALVTFAKTLLIVKTAGTGINIFQGGIESVTQLGLKLEEVITVMNGARAAALNAGAAVGSFGVTLAGLKAGALALVTPLTVVAGVLAVVVGAIALYNKHKQAPSKQLEKDRKTLEATKEKYSEINKEYDELLSRQKDLVSQGSDLNDAEKKRLELLKEQTSELKDQQKQQLANVATSTVGTLQYTKTGTKTLRKGEEFAVVDTKEVLRGQKAFEAMTDAIAEAMAQYEAGEITLSDYNDRTSELNDQLDGVYDSYLEVIRSGGELNEQDKKNYDALVYLKVAWVNAGGASSDYAKALAKISPNTSDAIKITDLFSDSLEIVGNKYYFVTQAAKDAAVGQLNTEISLTESVLQQVDTRIAARALEYESIAEFNKEALRYASPSAAGQFYQSEQGQTIQRYYKLKENLEALKKIKVRKTRITDDDTSGGGDTGGGGGGGGSDKSKQKKDYLSTYKKQLESYQKAQEEAYKKGEISADQYYTNVRKKGEAYYKKLKAMGTDYADDAKSMYQAYRDANTDAVNDIFDEIEYKYKEGTIDGQKYYEQIWKYAKKFYKNGKLDFDSYRSYIKKGYETMFDSIKKQYESGQITAEQYMSKVKKAQSKASSSISSAAKSGSISGSTIVETRNALKIAAIEAKNAAAKALKEAAIEAAEAAVKAAEKKLEEAQKRQEKANTFISALQFWADEQTAAIDKTIDGYNAQIDALNEQLDLMDEQNDALDKQAERIKLVNALEEAKKQKTVRVYDSQLGWIWTEDPRKVADAQTALNDFDTARKREEEQKAIQDQIKALEALIKEKEKEKQAYQDVIDEQTNALNRYNIEAELGMTIEKAIFEGRIANFENWKNAYINGTQEVIAAIGAVNSAQAELDAANAALDAANAMVVPEIKYGITSKTGSVYEYTDDMSATERWNAAQTENIQTRKDQGYKVNTWYDSGGKLHYTAKSTKESKEYVRNNPEAVLKKATGAARNPPKNKKASGSLSLPSTGIYNVNELGDELMIPPTGNYDFLKKGTGIIPADLTKNLMDWGQFNPKNLIGAQPAITHNDHSITIQNLTVKSDNAKEFVRQLQNLAIVRS